MDIVEYREYCVNKPGVTEETPFGPNILVFKVMGKMFALTDIDIFESVNLKCDPEWAQQLRSDYQNIKPGYHMNKKHWNTVMVNPELSDSFFRELIDHSYELVVSGLTQKLKNQLETIKKAD